MLINLLPFIIFVSSLKFLVDIRNNRDLLSMKIFGYSNFKIFIILSVTSFLIGWMALVLVNPLTSTMSKYYEKTKSIYSKDIDHLVSFNNNGLWIKENLDQGYRIITANQYNNENLNNVVIFNLDKNLLLKEKIYSENANIKNTATPSIESLTCLNIAAEKIYLPTSCFSPDPTFFTYLGSRNSKDMGVINSVLLQNTNNINKINCYIKILFTANLRIQI